MKNLGKFSEEQFQNLKSQFQGGAKSLGIMTDTQFGQIKNQSMQFGKDTEGKINPQDALLSPGSTFVEPGLRKFGVGPRTAFGIGFAADVFAPGPGELKTGLKDHGF